MTRTTKQKLDADPMLAWSLDNMNEPLRWSPTVDSTDEVPIVTIETATYFETNYVTHKA